MSSIFPHTFVDNVIEVKGLGVHYGEKKILDNVTFDIANYSRPGMAQGQVVAILGRSGIGKTQLFRCLAGLQEPTVGSVTRAGHPRMPPKAGEVGVVLQSYPLMKHRTVRGNLELVSSDSAKIDELLANFGLADKRNYYPADLSGGQRQRVAIIQQLLCSEHFILMDEPFTGLDPIAKEHVGDIIRKVTTLHEDNTVVMITHDIEVAMKLSDNIFMLGRNYNDKGEPIPGAFLKHKFDLVERNIAWHGDPTIQPNYASTLREIYECFKQS